MLPAELPKIYNPASQSRKELIDNFVVRTSVFKEIFNDIKKSKMEHPEQHYIIQGVRGQGKTTLLLRIAYEIQTDKSLNKRIIPVVFNEEQPNINRLYKLWETAAEYLDEYKEFSGLYDLMQELELDDDFEERCFRLIENALKKKKKKLILFIDNIDHILDKLNNKEHHRLREVFMESAELRVIGASSVSLEFHHDYGKPFYQFFKMPQLRGLNYDETKTLLLRLGEYYKQDRVIQIVENEPARIEALRRMTGGVVRTIIILFDIFVDDNRGNAFMDLERILDLVTPMYQHRIDKLTPQQQEIVDFTALKWDAVTVGDISKKIKLQSKAVSAQLKQLEKYNIVDKEKTNTKNFLYRLHERFFNIWYLMRLGRKRDSNRIRWLVEFLQIWCDDNELEKRTIAHIEKGDSNSTRNLAQLYFSNKKHKQEAMKLAEKAYNIVKNTDTIFTYSNILIWHDQFKQALKISEEILNNKDSIEEYSEGIISIFLLLLAKKQYHLVNKIFQESPHNLKDRFKPIYYTLMTYLKKEYPNEYRKMGPELKQTVDEILAKVSDLEKEYT